MGLAFQSYLVDNNDDFMPVKTPASIWWCQPNSDNYFVTPYLDMKNVNGLSKPGNLLDCPSNNDTWTAGFPYMNYGYNSTPVLYPLCSWSLAGKAKVSRFKASQVVMFGDLLLVDGDGTVPQMSILAYGWCACWNNIPVLTYTVSGLWWGHRQSANCTYLDGHVESKKKSDLSDNNFSGKNL